MWKDNSIRDIRIHVSFPTDEKSFDLGSVGCSPHLRINLAKKTRRSASCQNHKSLCTAIFCTGRRLWFFQLIRSLTSNLYTVLFRQFIRENKSINSHAQNTTVVSAQCNFNWNWIIVHRRQSPYFSCATTVKVTIVLVSRQQFGCTKCLEQS